MPSEPPSDLPFPSAAALAAAIAARQLSPLEAMRIYLDRADRLDAELNAFALRDDERALADATAATEQLARSGDDLPPLFGVPIPIKDLENVAGWPTTLGSWASSPDPVDEDDPVVSRFRGAGAVLMGKTTTPEFGTVSFTESDRLGITRNPWNPDHTPGGSSGGAAAAVASGMAPIAHASDGAGSIRIPASCCGLVGLKPGRHRITGRYEVMAGGVTSGVVSRTVEDTALALDVLAVFDPLGWNVAPAPERPFLDEVRRDPGRLRILVSPDSPLGVPNSDTISDSVTRFAKVVETLGHEVTVGAPDWPDPVTMFGAFLMIWGNDSVLLPLADPTRVEPHDRRPSPPRTADEVTVAVRDVQLGTRLLAAQFGRDFDVMVTPTMAVEPPRCGSWLEGVTDDDPAQAILNCLPMGTFTAMFNMSGLPAMSVPFEVAASGLPVGMQLVGGPWQEA
ncbi:MAG TPA: amidase, partial [Microthrixaceae bacterium]|nr:amidase [Microthrixaceae bacterium]